MSKKILIDSSKEDETRIALTENNQLEEYEIESSNNKNIKSNVYLAKISRVEASLQAAFVDFGGNRHGFLPFTEIHPDYFKIPVSDQKKLKEIISKENKNTENFDANNIELNKEKENEEVEEKTNEEVEESKSKTLNFKEGRNNNKRNLYNFFKKYKIQEVVKPRQIILVQVSKGERGLKGAALTTFLSFAGRYCVLMPNSNSNIGISRKIQDPNERKKLIDILNSIGVPKGMSVIIRTAGIDKTKKEIEKDLNFLLSQWNKIRTLTLKSNAPFLIYEEGSIIKRTIRDLYTKEILSINVEGKTGYKIAKDYIKELLPTQISKLKLYKEKKESLFTKSNIEDQINALYNNEIKLSSGASIVINLTEALVAIDVNSGKSTQYRNIETTALNTNLEAAKEIARQLKLRDLAGLIVIDFIDMEDHRNNFKVEKMLRTSTNSDRARIQIGRISTFGLMELSRQRLRIGVIERSLEKCKSCGGTGRIRNNLSITDQLFKVILQNCVSNKKSQINIKCNSQLADEILNKKKKSIIELEKEYECKLKFEFSDYISLNQPSVQVNLEKSVEKDESKNEKSIKLKNKKYIKKNISTKKKSNIKIKKAVDKTKKIINENIKIEKDNEENIKKGWWSQ